MNTQIVTIVEEQVREQLQAQAAFTALDVSNALKAAHYPVRHSDVAVVVRDIYGSGAMDAYNYRRVLIDVVTDGGQKPTQAFLYLPQPARQRDYAARAQDALPPVPADRARDLSDCMPAGAASVLPRPAHSAPRSGRGHTRRDGALSVPLALVRMLGWTAGVTLSVRVEAGQITVSASASTQGIPLRVWQGERVRVCRRTLRLSDLRIDSVTWDVRGGALHIAPKPT